MKGRVTIVPWTENFIGAAASHLAARFPEGFTDVTVIFPHRRAGRYLLDAFLKDENLSKPLLLPEIVSVEEWLSSLGARLAPKPPRMLGALDRAGLLFEIVRGLRETLGGRAKDFPEDLARFFPWGMRLAELCEELFRQNVPAVDLLYARDQVLPPAAAILENLSAIHGAYRERLLADGAATPGLCQALAAENAGAAADLLRGKHLVSCGAYVMSGAEKSVCRALFDRGALEFLWHADPVLAERPEQAHFACREQALWLRDWKIKAGVLGAAPAKTPAKAPERRSLLDLSADAAPAEIRAWPPCLPAMRFYEGYDLHSQLAALVREMEDAQSLEDCAVALPDTGMLMPVLHHLPRKDVNISMGYPLARSSLAQLIETLLRLQESRLDARLYYWRDVAALLRHPYLKMLRIGEAEPLRALFHAWEAGMRQGGKYLDPFELPLPEPEPGDGPAVDPEALDALRRKVLAACFTGFAQAETLNGLGRALAGLSDLLLTEEHCGDVWERYLIDAECLFRLADAVIPALTGAAIGDEALPRQALFAALRGLLKAERVAFEADPLSGLQILGLLETRLMTFKTVYILDAVDEAMPGAAPYDPLLPDALRSLLGLPDGRRRDLVAAYNFYRLLMGARDAAIFYQSGVQGGGVFEEKSVRSRFVEQLLWELEKKRGRIIKPGEEPLRAISLPLRPIPKSDASAPKTPAIQDRLEKRLAERPLSASFFDAYLRCPLQFFYRYLTPLKPLDEVAEDGDAAAFGDMTHKVLQTFFEPYSGREIKGDDLPLDELQDLYLTSLAKEAFFSQSPPDLRLILERVGCERLRRFLENTPRTMPLAFETFMKSEIGVNGATYALQGKADRVDKRDDGLVILDYKTGSVKKPAAGFWEDDYLMERLDLWTPGHDPAILDDLSKGLKSIQLPLYMLLHASDENTRALPENAAFVELRDAGREIPLFEPKFPPESRALAITQTTPAILAFLLRSLLENETFAPAPSKGCEWCDWKDVCEARRG